jgi:hypothetical protein
MKLKTILAAVLLFVVLPVLADDAPRPPFYVQAIFTKYDRQAEANVRLYWQATLAADKAKLKDLQDAMVSAAKQNNADAIGLIQKAIDETKEKIKQDAESNGLPPAAPTTIDFKWLDGTKWHILVTGEELAFHADGTMTEMPDHVHGISHWKPLDSNSITVIEPIGVKRVVTFDRFRTTATYVGDEPQHPHIFLERN